MRSLYHNFISILYVVFLRWLAAELTGILNKNALVENSFESVNRSARNFGNIIFLLVTITPLHFFVSELL